VWASHCQAQLARAQAACLSPLVAALVTVVKILRHPVLDCAKPVTSGAVGSIVAHLKDGEPVGTVLDVGCLPHHQRMRCHRHAWQPAQPRLPVHDCASTLGEAAAAAASYTSMNGTCFPMIQPDVGKLGNRHAVDKKPQRVGHHVNRAADHIARSEMCSSGGAEWKRTLACRSTTSRGRGAAAIVVEASPIPAPSSRPIADQL
jgi:hypothetical protein